MRELTLEQCQVTSGGEAYLSLMGTSLMDGLDEHEKAFLFTGLGAGIITGALVGRLGLLLGAGTIGAYYAYDKFLKGTDKDPLA